jgi:hypothetical protein
MIRPRVPFLVIVSALVDGVAIGAWAGAIVGVQAAVFTLTGIRLLQPPWSLVLIYVGLIAASVALIPLKRWIAQLDAASRTFRLHQRNGERKVTPHRRATDIPDDIVNRGPEGDA